MSFALDIRKFAERAGEKVDLVVRKVILDLGTSVVEKSPVGDATLWSSPPPPGYVGGRFRGNWQYGFGEMPVGVLETIDPTGGESVQRILSGSSQSPVAGLHYISNNLPYAQRLEEGWSSQAPAGMVSLSVVEFKSIVDKAASE